MGYRELVRSDGPAGYWPLDETSGSTAYDLGSTGVNGTYNGTIALGGAAFPGGGRAPVFGGSDATTTNVSIADNAAWSGHAGASGVQTWEYWFRPSSTTFFNGFPTGWFFIFGKAGSGGVYEQYSAILAGSFISQLGTSTGSPLVFDFGPGKIDEGRWHHAVTVYNRSGSSAALWLNGRRVSETTSFGGTSSDTAAGLTIGGKTDAAEGFFRGSIAHVAIYNKVLGADRIQAHYRAGRARPVRRAFRTRLAA